MSLMTRAAKMRTALIDLAGCIHGGVEAYQARARAALEEDAAIADNDLDVAQTRSCAMPACMEPPVAKESSIYFCREHAKKAGIQIHINEFKPEDIRESITFAALHNGICPVCGEKLFENRSGVSCMNGHGF